MGDATRKKLQMPPWHIPYLEKHRIYELFHVSQFRHVFICTSTISAQELARELVIQQPVDHVTFLKQLLTSAAKSRDVARVVLLGAPKVNCLEVGKQIAQSTGHVLITESSIMECFTKVLKLLKKLNALK